MKTATKSENKQSLDMKTQQLHTILNQFADVLQNVSGEARHSAQLIESNITTAFARQVQETLSDPLAAMVKTYASAEEGVRSMMYTVVRGLIKRNSHLISSVWKINDSEATLELVIVLKDYNLQSRSVFNEFLTSYECTGLSSRLPIVFRYLPERLASGIQHDKAVKIEVAA
ncbi:hypothetical protein [Pontibacter liquoris]|uniref:hypothetical protein n=1 Tax=Pontibacter liquoris TaxID=2905677 RepID=UPI001FA7ABEA|nr:hypothetical protein [Pontibacter liquoris]